MKSPKKLLIYYYVIAFIIILLLNTFLIPIIQQRIEQVNYNTLLTMIESIKSDYQQHRLGLAHMKMKGLFIKLDE